MKKTLIALMALAGVAMAESRDITFDSYYTTSAGVSDSLIDVLQGKVKGQYTPLQLKADMLAVDNGASFTVTVSELLASADVHPDATITLNSFDMLSRPDAAKTGDMINYTGDTHTITITLGENVWTSAPQTNTITENKYAIVSYAFGEDAPVFSANDVLTVTLNNTRVDSSVNKVYQTGFGVVQAFSGSTLHTGTDYDFSGWHNAIRLNTTVTPEPATATLSLLALAGLASRRRRH